MKKVALLGLLSVAVMANESGFYIGGEISQTKERAQEIDNGTYKYHNTSAAYGLNVGYYFDANTRAYTFYQHINRGDFDKPTNAYGAGYDYLFGDSSFKPFVGGIVSYSIYDNKEDQFRMEGLAYGGQFGIDYKINTNISVNAGYRYLLSDAKFKSGSYVNETTDFQAFFAGANYKF